MSGLLVSATPVLSQDQLTAPNAGEFHFSLKRLNLRSALSQFSSVTGIDIVGDGALPSGAVSGQLEGRMSPHEALSRLLAGTDLNYRFSNPTSVVIMTAEARSARAQEVLPEITVSGSANTNTLSTMSPPPVYAGGQVATGGQVGMLGNRNVMDTPFNQTNYTAQLIQNQQARTITDVTANDPSVDSALPRNATREQLVIRGFLTSNTDIGINGLYGLAGNNSLSILDGVERVEVLKGLSALVNGMSPGGSVGGSVNFVTKRAGDEPIAELTTTYASHSQFGTHLDVGRRYGDNKEFGVRFNGSYRNGNTEIDRQQQELGAAILGLDYRGDRFRISTDLSYDSSDSQPGQSRTTIQSGMPVPTPPSATNNWMQPWTYIKGRNLFAMTHAEVDLSDRWTAYGSVGASDSAFASKLGNPALLNADGDITAEGRLQRVAYQNLAWQGGLRGEFETGAVHHQVNFNVTGSSNEFKLASVRGSIYSSNIYNPVNSPNQDLTTPPLAKFSTTDLVSYGVADTLSILDKRVQFTVGVRRQQVASDNFDLATGALTSGYDSAAWTPAYMLVVKPLENVSVYANYIEGLQPGVVVDDFYNNAGQAFPPFRSKQYEAGVKVDWGRLTTTVSAFQITKPSTLVNVPANLLTVDGESRNRGIEINAFGEVTESIRVLGGVTFMDARQQKTEGGQFDGNRSIAIPNTQVRLGAEWDTPFLRGFTLTGRALYNDEVFADNANTLLVPSWTRFDVGARYTFVSPWNGKPITVRFMVENVFDKSFWMAAPGGNQLFLGSPRTYLASTTFRF